MMPVAWWLQAGGLTSGFVGALLLVVSQQAVPGDTAGQQAGSSFMPFVVVRHRRAWWVGLVVLCAGFLLQLLALFA